MSVGLKLVCLACNEWVYIGTLNSRTIEDPKLVFDFLWKHQGLGCCLKVLSEDSIFYDEFDKSCEFKIKED